MHRFSKAHLLSIKELDKADIALIFQTATHFKSVLERPIKKVPSLRDKTIANLFFESSTRTRLSFELAEKRLSADVINFSTSTSALKKGETLLDTVKNIVHMQVDMVVIRHAHAGVPHFVARHAGVCVVNAGDGLHEHPTQALLDAYSIQERLGSLQGRRILILGDVLYSRVALSDIFCFLKLGARVKLCAPPTLLPPFVQHLGVEIEYDLQKALRWCEVVNVLRIQRERQQAAFLPSLREYALYYGLHAKRLERLGKDILIMHPGPINRGIEMDSDVADSPHSIILQQVENGVAIRMAVLYLLSGLRHED